MLRPVNNIRQWFLASLLLLTALACTTTTSDPTPAASSRVRSNASEYARLLSARTTYGGTPFEIKGVSRNGSTLIIDVFGGCLDQDYSVVWDGTVRESNPIQISLMALYELTAQVQCAATLRHTITVDLKKLMGTAYQENMYVSVGNASKPVDHVIDPSGTVTIRK